jgi:hypothetical protein
MQRQGMFYGSLSGSNKSTHQPIMWHKLFSMMLFGSVGLKDCIRQGRLVSE